MQPSESHPDTPPHTHRDRRSIARLPWRYLATGSPVDVTARSRVDGSVRNSRSGQLSASFISRVIIFFCRVTRRIVILGALPPAPCVAVSLHRSYWDGPLICMLDPRITAVTSRTWKQTPGVGTYLEYYGVIWTEEDVVARASEYVRNGGICWLAPCGFVRSGDCPQPHTGAARIARATGAPIVCVTLKRGHPRSVFGRRPLTILIGEPLLIAADDTLEPLTDRLVAALHAQER